MAANLKSNAIALLLFSFLFPKRAMGRSVNVAGRLALLASQQEMLDKQPQPEPEDCEKVHAEREERLFGQRGTGAGNPAHIDRITRGCFLEKIFELLRARGLPGADGDFVDLGSGTTTANVVSYVSLVWPKRFKCIQAIDVVQDIGTMHEVMEMRRRVAGVHSNVSAGMLRDHMRDTADISWWTVTDDLSPGTLFQPFRGVASTCWYTSVLFARASMIYSCDLKFADTAVFAYRREILRSLVHSRDLVYVTCKEVGGSKMRTADCGQWVSFVNGTDDLHIGKHVRAVCKILAEGNRDVAWEDTVFYVVLLRGPNHAPRFDIAAPTLEPDDPAITAIRQATERSVHSAYAEVDRQTSLLEACAGEGVAKEQSLKYAELTEKSMNAIASSLTEENGTRGVHRDSTILDIGSGFGKAVLAFALTTPMVRSVTGIEVVQHRHAAAVTVVETLRQKSTSWEMRLENIFHIHGDAGSSGFDCSPYTHIFMFDAFFDDETHARIFSNLSKRPTFSALISFWDEEALIAKGWPMEKVPMKCAASDEVSTEDGKTFVFYVYERE